MVSFYGLLEASLLVLNGIAILNRERFLKKFGLSSPVATFEMPAQSPTVKQQLINLILAVQTVMRVPLIGINLLVIIIKLLVG
ncbi:hypothetical protein AB6A40_008844 [Gnathostoma spinigerum]|uniref:Immediate early response 3-interacting protein 1 n=1 Tax=Gnathostoma spinigerum TaxID=75299 RepID=A0ABD6ERG1_9BILA